MIYYHQALNGADPPEETWWLDRSTVIPDWTYSDLISTEESMKEFLELRERVVGRTYIAGFGRERDPHGRTLNVSLRDVCKELRVKVGA